MAQNEVNFVDQQSYPANQRSRLGAAAWRAVWSLSLMEHPFDWLPGAVSVVRRVLRLHPTRQRQLCASRDAGKRLDEIAVEPELWHEPISADNSPQMKLNFALVQVEESLRISSARRLCCEFDKRAMAGLSQSKFGSHVFPLKGPEERASKQVQ